MKMELEIKSPKKGVVKRILVKKGDTVAPGDTVAIIE
ncbi:MAG TPA: biotin/lipoyl-binding protein, partial [Thermoprotei archaeon]|nr:biotin/lipoyl-binding protein [Thermoprotei archaeon]